MFIGVVTVVLMMYALLVLKALYGCCSGGTISISMNVVAAVQDKGVLAYGSCAYSVGVCSISDRILWAIFT